MAYTFVEYTERIEKLFTEKKFTELSCLIIRYNFNSEDFKREHQIAIRVLKEFKQQIYKHIDFSAYLKYSNNIDSIANSLIDWYRVMYCHKDLNN